jgi:hypothetical protein
MNGEYQEQECSARDGNLSAWMMRHLLFSSPFFIYRITIYSAIGGMEKNIEGSSNY